jgi:hypothetical protein
MVRLDWMPPRHRRGTRYSTLHIDIARSGLAVQVPDAPTLREQRLALSTAPQRRR